MPVKENESLYLGGVTRIDFQSGYYDIFNYFYKINQIFKLIILKTSVLKKIIH